MNIPEMQHYIVATKNGLYPTHAIVDEGELKFLGGGAGVKKAIELSGGRNVTVVPFSEEQKLSDGGFHLNLDSTNYKMQNIQLT